MKMMNQRQVYGKKLVELGEKYKNIVVCEADLGKSTMSYMFQERFPERYFEMGIAEANMVSFATGLALTDKIALLTHLLFLHLVVLMIKYVKAWLLVSLT